MISVQSTIPGANGIDFYIDGVIKLKFSEEVADISLAKTLFTLYAVTGTAPNEMYGAASLTYSKNPSDKTEVWLTPQGDLLPNQRYMLLVKGDQNTGDAVKQGIVSITNDVMSGNFTLNFTTSNLRAPAPNIVIDVTPPTAQPILPGDTTTYTTVDGAGNVVIPDHLEIIGTEPQDLFNIQRLTSLRILFNQNIIPIVASGEIVTAESMVIDTMMDTVPLEIQSMEVSGNYIDLVFTGYMPDASGNCAPVYNNPLIQETAALPKNHKYRLIVHAGSLQVSGRSDVLLDNYQIDIDTQLFPMLVSVFEVRAQSRGLLIDKLPDQTIAYIIRQNSKWIMDRFGLAYNFCTGYYFISPTVEFYFRQWVICQSVYDAGRTYYTLNNQFRVSSKSLGDMSVSYTNPNINKLANPLLDPEDCAKNMLIYIVAKMGKGVSTPVKSSRPETDSYPARFRTEFLRRPALDPNQFRDRIRQIRYYDGTDY